MVINNLHANRITSDCIAANAIVSDKIAANAVVSDKIYAGAVIAGKIATGAIYASNLREDAVFQQVWKNKSPDAAWSDQSINVRVGTYFSGAIIYVRNAGEDSSNGPGSCICTRGEVSSCITRNTKGRYTNFLGKHTYGTVGTRNFSMAMSSYMYGTWALTIGVSVVYNLALAGSNENQWISGAGFSELNVNCIPYKVVAFRFGTA